MVNAVVVQRKVMFLPGEICLITLPTKRVQKKRESKAIIWTSQSTPGAPIECELSSLGPIELEVVTDPADVALWNELVDRHHYLGYRHPIGAALKYFILSHTDKTNPGLPAVFSLCLAPGRS